MVFEFRLQPLTERFSTVGTGTGRVYRRASLLFTCRCCSPFDFVISTNLKRRHLSTRTFLMPHCSQSQLSFLSVAPARTDDAETWWTDPMVQQWLKHVAPSHINPRSIKFLVVIPELVFFGHTPNSWIHLTGLEALPLRPAASHQTSFSQAGTSFSGIGGIIAALPPCRNAGRISW